MSQSAETTNRPGRTYLTFCDGRTLKVVPAVVDGQDGVAIDVVRIAPGKARRLVVTLYFTRAEWMALCGAGMDSIIEGAVNARLKGSTL